ncbi:zinc finger Ran-binding domain-containing protein 2 isoform X1 [Betta splendens]|uniref:Zinc finger Ran-binding domain-containing protein 2 n=1 Tax=Betta splendens TaxID=158456 RepID=A0A6P7MBE3_BETSP|nr:zinc finger Ran-binding domain-containing protein 2 isoform X1 [Betta splendens]
MSGKSFRVSDGDWICPDKKCGNVNFARRTSCNRCGREKTTEAKMMKTGGTEIGKTLAEKSRGLFSANDWQCKTCGNVNWARRSECNMCNTPKYAKLEERTGYGGGFNERENVEYIEREESDGEYDEFGRKKKKYRGKTSTTSSSKEPEKKEVVKRDEEEEEEEDDEEDGDLSKYKLDDDDEDDGDGDLSKYDLDASDEDKAAKKKGSRSGSSRSRSSSRSSSSSSRSRSRSRSRSSSSSRSGSRSRSHSRSSSRSGKGSSPRKRSRSPSSSPERSQKRSRSRSSSGGRKRRRSRSRSSERFGFLWNTTMALIFIRRLALFLGIDRKRVYILSALYLENVTLYFLCTHNKMSVAGPADFILPMVFVISGAVAIPLDPPILAPVQKRNNIAAA